MQQWSEQLYNILMGAIEPDLRTDMIPILDELYLGETEDEYKERMSRYAAAIEQFQKRAAEFAHDFKSAIVSIGDKAMALAKQMQQEVDSEQVKSAEESIERT